MSYFIYNHNGRVKAAKHKTPFTHPTPLISTFIHGKTFSLSLKPSIPKSPNQKINFSKCSQDG